jgi:phosphoglycerol transferase MdoB-like AlkP superfamily enzyme
MIKQSVQKLAIKIRPLQVKIELILFVVLVAGIITREHEIGNIFIVMPLSLLAMLFYLMAFRIENKKNRFLTFINRATYFSLSTGMIGILFTIQHYPYATMMLRIALLSMIISLVGLIIIKITDREKQYKIDSDLIRTFIIIITIVGLMTFTEQSDFYEFEQNMGQNKKEIIKD